MSDWDRFDIEDLKQLLPLTSDDVDHEFQCENPNRLLKAMRISSSRRGQIRKCVTCAFLIVVCVVGWICMERYWRLEDAQAKGKQLSKAPLADWLIDYLLTEREEA